MELNRKINGTDVPAVNENGTLKAQLRMREKTSEAGETCYSLSIYNSAPASREEIYNLLFWLNGAFGDISEKKLTLMAEAAYNEYFTPQRLKDAINYVIKNFRYREPTVADIVSYDKCLRLYTYSEACRLVNSGQARFENDGGDLKIYCKHPVCLWYRVSDAVKCGLVKSER